MKGLLFKDWGIRAVGGGIKMKAIIEIPKEKDCNLCWFFEDYEYSSNYCGLFWDFCQITDTNRIRPCGKCLEFRNKESNIIYGIKNGDNGFSPRYTKEN